MTKSSQITILHHMFFHLPNRNSYSYISCFLSYQLLCILNFDTVQSTCKINVYTNVPHTVHVLFILSKISKDILRTCLRTFEADIPKIFKNFSLKRKIRRSYKKKRVYLQYYKVIPTSISNFFPLALSFEENKMIVSTLPQAQYLFKSVEHIHNQ